MKHILFILLMVSGLSLAADPVDSSRLINSIDVGHPLISLDYSPNGNLLAVAGSGNTIDVYQPTLGVKVKTLTGGHKDDVLAVRFSPDNRLLATGGVDKRILIWDIASGTVIREMTGHTDYVRDLDFSPDGFYVASASWDGHAIIWETGTGRQVLDLDRHPDDVTSVAYGNEGKHVITACGDHKLRKWSTKDGTLLRTFEGHKDEIWNVKWSAVSNVVASCGWDNTARIWNAAEGALINTFPGHVTDVWSVSFSSDGTMLGTSGGDRTVKLWDLPTGKQIMTLTEQAHESDVEEIDFSPDGTTLATCGRDGMIKFWRVPVLEERLNSAVNISMEEWARKGKFEKSDEYASRIRKKDKQSNKFRGELEQKLALFFEENVNWNNTITIGEYNADGEYFLLSSPVLGQMRLKVKPDDAQKVAEKMDRIEFRDLDMKVVKGDLVVNKLTAYFKGMNRRYLASR